MRLWNSLIIDFLIEVFLMNKLAKALVLAFVFAAPVAIYVPEVHAQTKPAPTAHSQPPTKPAPVKPVAKKPIKKAPKKKSNASKKVTPAPLTPKK